MPGGAGGTSSSGVIRVLVLPFFRRYWLLHAWRDAAAAQQAAAAKPWREGADLQEKLRLLAGSVQRWGAKQADQQWQKLATAAPGTLNNRLHRLARDVLARVDPNESFLKIMHQQADALTLRYPSSVPERLVRRRLRLLAAHAQPFHASRLRLWSVALIPQLPLIPLPLPNVTIYFTVWRIISNRSAAAGAAALQGSLDLLSDVQRLALAQQLRQLEQQGTRLAPGSWPAQLVADTDRLQRRVQEALQCNTAAAGDTGKVTQQQQPQQPQQQQQQKQQENQQQPQPQQKQRKARPPLLPVFIPDAEMDAIVQPHSRLATPLPESAANSLAALFSQPGLLEHYGAARKQCEQGAADEYH